MPDIEITEDQRDRLRAVQEALAADVVGKYGHVRPSDAVEYLLDRYEVDEGESAGGETGNPGTVGTETGGEGGAEPGGGSPDATDGAGADDGGDADESTTGAGNGSDGTTDDGEGATVTGGDAAELDAMMNLLAEHDDRWRESEAAEARYEVDLPDGTTEHARTKDDVRGLLFRHYR